jgi:hypothetical protein
MPTAQMPTAHTPIQMPAHTTIQTSALPLVFQQNAGQFPSADLFAGSTQQYTLELRAHQMRFTLPGERVLTLSFANSHKAQPQALTEVPFRTNIYIGNDPAQWHTGLRNYDRVALDHLYPGIDAQFYTHANEIEHDFYVARQADPAQLALTLAGADSTRLTPAGDLVLGVANGALRLHKPVAYQLAPDGTRQPVAARFVLAANHRELRFALGAYDHARTLVIDPVITYATYVAGSSGSTPTAIAVDASGNVYLTGTTASTIASFAAASTSSSPTGLVPTTAKSATFIAQLASTASGSQIAWLTYYGSTAATVQPNALALQPGGSTLYIGGQTTATNLPGTGASYTTYDHAPTANGSTYGFLATFAAGTGVFAATTYVEATSTAAGTTAIAALAVDNSGNVTAAGQTTGESFTVTTNAFLVPTGVITNTSLLKGIVLRLDSTLTTEAYGTYIAGDSTTTTASTVLTGVALDSASNIYLSGNTYGNFPQAGAYSTNAVNTAPGGKLGYDAFVCEIAPTNPNSTLPYVYWSGGTKNDQVAGLNLDASNNLYFFGQTQSTNLITNNATTRTNLSSSNAPTTPLDSTFPANTTTAAFVGKLDSTGRIITTTFLAGPGAALSTTSTASAAAIDASGNLYLTGQTNAPKAAFPQATSGTIANIPALPALEDPTPDSTATTLNNRSFVLQLPPALTSVTYRAYLGPASGSSAGVGIAVDNSANAYVLSQSAASASSSAYTNGSAAQPYPQLANGSAISAYLAQIAFAAPNSAASLTSATPTYTPSKVGYLSTTNLSTLVLNWQITGASSGANSVVFNLPYSPYLKTYALSAITLNGAALSTGVCTLTTANAANTKPGLTCILPTLASGTAATFVLTTPVTAAVATAAASASTITIPAQAFDAQGDSLDLTQTVSIGLVPTFTLTDSVSAPPSPATYFYAANSTTDTTTPNTSVTYTFTIKNTSATADSPNTKLNLNLSSTYIFTPVTTTSSTGCDPTTATTGCDIPAGGTLTLTISGVYLVSQFTYAGPFTVTNTAPTLTYTPVTNVTAPKGTTTTLSVGVYPQPQTITFAPASPVNYGTVPIQLNGTATSGLAVTYTLGANSPATLNSSNNTLTVTGVGTIIVYANQNGAYNYARAPQVTGTIVVNQESQTITFPQPNSPLTYGAAPFTVTATASSNLAVVFTLGAGSPATLSGSTITITGGGTIVINANQPGNKLYSAAPTASQSVIVTAAPQTITFPAPPSPVMYGAAPITLAATSSSGLTITYSLVTGSPATLSGSTVTVNGIGTVTVNAAQAGNSSYQAATTVQQSIVVNQASQTINFTAVPSPLTYPASPVMLSATSSSGLPVTLTLSAGSPATLNGSTLTFNGVGTSIVTATQAGNADYLAAPTLSQSIVVNKATPTLTWAGSTIPYGTSLASTLNATASVPGTFAYSYGASAVLPSTILPAGTYPLTVVFTPTDSTDYAVTSTSATVFVIKVPAAITVVSSSNPVVSGTAVTFTAALPVAATGSVLFLDGTNQIGSGYITAGIAAFTTSALAVGSHSITAVYGGDTNFTGGASLAVNEVITDFSLVTGSGSNSITTATVHRGQTANYAVVVTPSNMTFAAPVTFTITGLPTGATAIFTPGTIAAGAGSTSVAIAVAVPSNLAQLDRPRPHKARDLAPIVFALLFLPLLARRRARQLGSTLLALLLLLVAATEITGCAGTTPAPETYTLTVSATSSGLTRTTTLFLIVD